MGDFLLTDIITESSDTKEVILKILQARGFLIDCSDGRYYLTLDQRKSRTTPIFL